MAEDEAEDVPDGGVVDAVDDGKESRDGGRVAWLGTMVGLDCPRRSFSLAGGVGFDVEGDPDIDGEEVEPEFTDVGEWEVGEGSATKGVSVSQTVASTFALVS